MNDPDDDTSAERALLDAFDRGTPLGRTLERVLDETGGPVPVDDAELARAAEALHRRIAGRADPGPTRRWALVAAAAAVVTGGAAGWRWSRNHEVVQSLPATESPGLALAPRTVGTIRLEQLSLSSGAARLDARCTLRSVALLGPAVTLDPVGEDQVAGVSGTVGAVGVVAGMARLVGAAGTLGVLRAGEWAVLVGAPAQLHRFDDRSAPILPASLDEATRAAIHELVGALRWLSLPEATRRAVPR